MEADFLETDARRLACGTMKRKNIRAADQNTARISAETSISSWTQRENVFIGGFDGKKTNQVDCFNIHTKTWSEAKRTKQTRWASSLAAIDDKLFGGGGWGYSDAECFLIKEDRWVDIKPNTNEGGLRRGMENSWRRKDTAPAPSSKCTTIRPGDWLPLPPMS